MTSQFPIPREMQRWDPDFARTHPLFAPLLPLSAWFRQMPSWPSLAALNERCHAAPRRPRSGGGRPLRFAKPGPAAYTAGGQYEQRIYHLGEVQTRRNWHDLFNACAWLTFPRAKAAINRRHVLSAGQRPAGTNRSAAENAVTLLDECGVIIVSSDEGLLEMIRNFHWQSLFHRHRERTERHLRCLPIGHALYEKALAPYVGMTGHALLCPVTEQSISAPLPQLVELADRLATERIDDPASISGPGDLAPFPVLGMPGWWSPQNAAFYQDSRYFRPGRSRLRAGATSLR